jgi:3-oxoacyl-[acyl-carrier-protein] synthase III
MPKAIRAAIIGTGAAVPTKVVTNADLEKILDTSDEWITQRTGIRERRVAGNDLSTAPLAIEAARKALASAQRTPQDIDLILCATVTPEMLFPSTACLVQEALGVKDIPAFDLAAACSGFVYALSTASTFIESGKYRRILVIGAETLTKVADYTDRSSCILFGDGAGAVVLEATTEPRKGVEYSVLCADGSGWDYIYVPAGGSRHPATHETVEERSHYVKMKGREVYKFAVDKMQWLLGHCMEKCGLSVNDVDMVIPHQVNSRIIQSAAEKHNFPMDKIYMNIDRYGNTSSASIPLALDEALKAGRIGPGSLLLMVAFGSGLTWAGAVVRL